MTDTEFRIQLNKKICEIADLFLYHYNPCKREPGKDICFKGKVSDCCEGKGCANPRVTDGLGCQFCGQAGCTIDNAGCRIYLCDIASQKTDHKCRWSMKALEIITRIYALSTYWDMQEDGEYPIDDLLKYFKLV
jgi:hypothetical protein